MKVIESAFGGKYEQLTLYSRVQSTHLAANVDTVHCIRELQGIHLQADEKTLQCIKGLKIMHFAAIVNIVHFT